MDARTQARHGPRGSGLRPSPSPGPDQLREILDRCGELRGWARVHGLALSGVPGDLELLERAIDEWPADQQPAALGNEAGLFLGTVIIASAGGASWRIWPNGHPVIRLASGRELDVVAMANDRVRQGSPRLIDVFTDAALTPSPEQTHSSTAPVAA